MKKGDKVLCINNSGYFIAPQLKHIYTIVKIKNDTIYLDEIGYRRLPYDKDDFIVVKNKSSILFKRG